ncbi:NADP-dependent oxidoreductase [Leifsonia sp. F6_8S_P_1B]|uniref:NADP-dependent oxidoreductase n=1 Tax=Leifsonia williamsii TaxID=3035919 RepID=A0ABT8K8X0_9MICO|nr:NADP-dependent oxidoreductase [Leifsonia williamsii]MDN4613895.1 NADP-dependent oxidoreductase [Leifsonia williamsii]
MKAVRFHEFGGPEVLRIDEVEVPAPGAGEVRVRVAGVAFNPADNGIRSGVLRAIPVTLPHVPGYDVSGTVDALGEGVTGLTVGDAVIGFLPMAADGAAAEYVIAPAEALVAAPASIPLADAAALPSVALTAWQALFDDGGLQAGQRVLISGAGGAVGGYAVQLAKAAGAHVIATASPRSAAAVAAAGADEVIDHTTTDVLGAVTEPVDVLLNLAPIDPDAFTALVARVRDGGVVVSTTAWMPAPSDARRDVRSVVVFVRSDAAQLAELVRRVDAGGLRVEVARRVPLADLPIVHREAAAGTLRGKVVAVPDAA